MSHRKHVETCLNALADSTLTADQLRDAFAAMGSDEDRRQDLLYLQAVETGLGSRLLGCRMLIDGQLKEPEEEPWPYDCVLDATKDGWRVISFPNMALCLDENRTYGLGFEFILEKWR